MKNNSDEKIQYVCHGPGGGGGDCKHCMPNLTPTPPPTTPSGSVEEILKEFEKSASKSIAEMIDYGVETKDFHQRLKSFLTTAYALGRSSMKSDIEAVVPEGMTIFGSPEEKESVSMFRSKLLGNINNLN